MKRSILLFIVIVLLGISAIFLPKFLSSQNKEKEAVEKVKQEIQKTEIIKSISSNPDTIKSPDIVQSVPELFDPEQMFFLGIENLYDYLHFNQVEDIKQKVQFYVHNNIDKNLLDCEVIKNSIQNVEGVISFDLKMESVKSFSVLVTVNEKREITDITIHHSLN